MSTGSGDRGDRFYGLYRGFILDNKDPEHQGRLKVAVPSVYGNDSESGDPLFSTWAHPKWAMCGIDWGTQFIPPVKNPDGSKVYVWVEFEMGDQKKPVWSGCFVQKAGLYKPMQEVFPSKPYIAYAIRTPRENTFYVNDNDDKGVMELVDRLGQYLRISSGEKQFIELKDKWGNKVTMDESGITLKNKSGSTFVV